MKLPRHWTLSACLGWYCKPYFDNSIAQVTILPTKLGRWSICLIGWSILTMIGCAWKYKRNIWAKNLARITFSTFGYRNLTFWSAQILKFTGFWDLSLSLTNVALIAFSTIAKYRYNVSPGFGFVNIGWVDNVSLNYSKVVLYSFIQLNILFFFRMLKKGKALSAD